MEKKSNLFAVISLCLAIGNIFLFLLLGNTLGLVIIELVGLVVCLGAAITGIVGVIQIGKDETQKGKGMAITGTVLGIIGVFYFGLGYVGIKMLDDPEFAKQFCVKEDLVTDCVKNEDDTATCLYAKSVDITCKVEDLKDTQFK